MKPLLLVTCATVLLTTSLAAQSQNRENVLTATGGRFVFGQIGPARADQFLLDTKTGRLWQLVADEKGTTTLQPIGVYQSNGVRAFSPEPEEETETARIVMLNRARKPYTAEDYEAAAKDFDAEGRPELAAQARAAAAKLKK